MLASLVVWGIGLLVKLNQELTRASRNNFRGNKQGWENWQGRVVLITGGKFQPFTPERFRFTLVFVLMRVGIRVYCRCGWSRKRSSETIESERVED